MTEEGERGAVCLFSSILPLGALRTDFMCGLNDERALGS